MTLLPLQKFPKSPLKIEWPKRNIFQIFKLIYLKESSGNFIEILTSYKDTYLLTSPDFIFYVIPWFFSWFWCVDNLCKVKFWLSTELLLFIACSRSVHHQSPDKLISSVVHHGLTLFTFISDYTIFTNQVTRSGYLHTFPRSPLLLLILLSRLISS